MLLDQLKKQVDTLRDPNELHTVEALRAEYAKLADFTLWSINEHQAMEGALREIATDIGKIMMAYLTGDADALADVLDRIKAEHVHVAGDTASQTTSTH
jgi:hypothetical protein